MLREGFARWVWKDEEEFVLQAAGEVVGSLKIQQVREWPEVGATLSRAPRASRHRPGRCEKPWRTVCMGFREPGRSLREQGR